MHDCFIDGQHLSFRRQVYSFCFHFGCCSHHWLTWAPLTFAAYDHFLTHTSTERAWFCKYTICYRQQWISLPFWHVCWGQVVLGGRTTLSHPGVWEWVELICMGARLHVRERGREGEMDMWETASLPQLLLHRRKEQKKHISACLLI